MEKNKPPRLKNLWAWSAILGAALVGVVTGLLLPPPGTTVTVILLLVGIGLLALGFWRGKSR